MTETVYKLTDADMRTRGDTQWVIGEERTAPGGGSLCSDRWLHAYADPLIAELMDSVHGNFGTGKRLFRCEAVVGAREPLKLGCTSLTLIEELSVPEITPRQRVAWAILCVRAIPGREPFPKWEAWADAYLARDAGSAAVAVERAAERAAAKAAKAAVSAAWAEAKAAEAKAWAWASRTWAAEAAEAAAEAAQSAARAAEAAGASSPEIDFAGLAQQAMEARDE